MTLHTIPAAPTAFVVTVEYDPTGLVSAHLRDYRVVSWVVDDIIVGMDNPAPRVTGKWDRTRQAETA